MGGKKHDQKIGYEKTLFQLKIKLPNNHQQQHIQNKTAQMEKSKMRQHCVTYLEVLLGKEEKSSHPTSKGAILQEQGGNEDTLRQTRAEWVC